MIYKLVMKYPFTQETFSLHYDSCLNELRLDGKKIEVKIPEEEITPPGYFVRVVMGTSCNFSCGYCMQGDNKKDINPINAQEFVESLHKYLDTKKIPIRKLEFWGGEPLLYFEQIKELYEAFKKFEIKHTYVSSMEYMIPTNGKLLKGEPAEWILNHWIPVMLSYDGTGQDIRGEDILQDPEIVDTIKKLYAKKLLSINMVITKNNIDVSKSVELLKEVIGGDDFTIGESRILKVTSDCGYENRVPEELLEEFTINMYKGLLSGKISQWNIPQLQAKRFAGLLNKPLPNHPNCVAIKSNSIIVDVAGNILKCHNESGEKNIRGNIKTHSFETTSIIKIPRWNEKLSTRCKDCLVRVICYADCPMLPEKYDEYNCKASYASSLPVLALSLFQLTGGLLTKTEKEEGNEKVTVDRNSSSGVDESRCKGS